MNQENYFSLKNYNRSIGNFRFQCFTSLSRLGLILLTLLVGFISCDKKHGSLVIPELKTEIHTPQNITAKVSDKKVTLTWEMKSIRNIAYYYIFRKDTAESPMSFRDSSFTQQFIDSDIQNGRVYYFQISAVDSQGYEGKHSAIVSAIADVYSVSIQNGAEYTNSQDVTLNFTASATTQYVMIANEATFDGRNWESFVQTKTWKLTSGDGRKEVYAKFRNYDNNETDASVVSDIVLDTKAQISEVNENTDGVTKLPGETIHFQIKTGEANGEATIDIGTDKQGIKLYDDGSNSDQTADDGTYELDYIIPADLKVKDAVITGHFVDRADNVAADVTAASQVTIQESPTAIRLFPPVITGADEDALELIWTESKDEVFTSYRIFRSTSSNVDTTSYLLHTESSSQTTSYTDESVKENVTYYYRVFVYNSYNQVVGSNIVSGKINPKAAPEPVVLFQPAPSEESLTTLSLNWSQNEDDDFANYKIYRSEEEGVDTTDYPVATISDQNTTSYDDENLKENTTYYYRIYVYNNQGLSAFSNEVSGKTNANLPPEAVTLFEPYAPTNSFTSLELRWSENYDDDFASYKIYRDVDASVDSASLLITTITEQNTINYDDTDLEADNTYFYRIYVYDTYGSCSRSNVESGTTNKDEPPSAVQLAKPISTDSTTLSLSWSENDDSDFRMYLIYRSTTPFQTNPDDDTLVAIINGQSATTHTDTGLTPNIEYFYYIIVEDKGGNQSEKSKEVSGTPKP